MGIPPFHHESLSNAKGNYVLRNDRSADKPAVGQMAALD